MRMNDFLHALQAELNATEPNFGDDANTVLSCNADHFCAFQRPGLSIYIHSIF